ncbi:MAG: sugar transferase [Cyclobacteriaceae bacterium]|nr:sugar transferase [Cyclobacteriaceae bacterium]
MANLYTSGGKRIFDIALSLLLITATAWLAIIICLLYVFTGNFPVLFRQLRTGRGEVPFQLVKFRTLVNSDQPPAQRQFWLGRLLRATNFDEWPQLWQVLKGEMSLVGPRPLPVAYLDLMTTRQRQRYTVRPGITGLVQVADRHAMPWAGKFELDVTYVDQCSLALDMRILWKTVLLVFSFRKDVSLNEEPLGK